MTDDYDGVVRVERAEQPILRRVLLPGHYVDVNQMVIRQRSITQVWHSAAGLGFTMWNLNANAVSDSEAYNPEIGPDEMLLKAFGEPYERYRVVDPTPTPAITPITTTDSGIGGAST